MPLSAMRGRPTRTITERAYDDAGRVARETSTTESSWTDADRWLALALTVHEASLCPGCSRSKAEAWHPDSEGWYEARGWTCHACEAIDQAVKRAKPGPHVHVTTVDTWPAGATRDPSAEPPDALAAATT